MLFSRFYMSLRQMIFLLQPVIKECFVEFNITNSQLKTVLGPHGQIVSLCSRGMEFCVPAAEAFTMELLNRQGDALLLKSSDFVCNDLIYSSCAAMPSIKVSIKISNDDKFLRFRPHVSGIPADWVLSWFDGPQVFFPLNDNIKLLLPQHDGVVISDPKRRIQPYHPIAFAKRGTPFGIAYPGRAQLQCMAIFREGQSGIYFAAHDCSGAIKAVEYEVLQDRVRLSLQTFTGADFGEDYAPDWDYVLSGIEGSWQRAAILYRDWLFEHGMVKKNIRYPKWLEDSPVILIYPVRGRGIDRGELEQNCYYPYCNILEYVDKFNAELDSRIMTLLMHWEGTAPWAPPYVWPPYGGEDLLAELRDALHEKGNLLGLYCSGSAWTCQSSIVKDYAPGCTPEQEKMMLRGPKGQLEATVCNGENRQRLGYELCPAEPQARKILIDEIMKMAEFDVDYSQFFDQNHGGGAHTCFARDHHHPPVPGAWLTAVQRSLMQEAIEKARALKKEMILGCESAAADVFAEYLPLNDARSPFISYYGQPVPFQQFVLHGITANFAGNQGGVGWQYDFERSPYNLNRRLAYAFCAGDLLSATLKENGNVHWAWGYEWDKPAPDQKMFWELMKNLNGMRKKYPEYLLYGRMMPDAVNVSGETIDEFDLQGNKITQMAFYHSTWQSPDGKKALIAVNYLDREQILRIGDQSVKMPPCSAEIFNVEQLKIKPFEDRGVF